MPPKSGLLPVSTPSPCLLERRLYVPYIYPISLPPTPISPAGTSVLASMYLQSSVMKDSQNRLISPSLLPLGLKSDPPLPPPSGNPVKAFLKICSNPKNFKIPSSTVGWKRKPPL